MLGQGAHLMGSLTTQSLQPRAQPASRAPLRGHAHLRLAQIYQRVRGHLGRILDMVCRQVGAKLAVSPLQRVTGQQVAWYARGLHPLDHLEAQGDLRLERAVRRDAQYLAGLGAGRPTPLFR